MMVFSLNYIIFKACRLVGNAFFFNVSTKNRVETFLSIVSSRDLYSSVELGFNHEIELFKHFLGIRFFFKRYTQ